jgi:hypothetical protein
MNPIAPLALALALLAPLAGAADGEVEDLAWRAEPRALDVRGSDAGFTFTSSRDSALGRDVMSGAFDAGTVSLTAAVRTQEPEPGSVRIDLAWTSLAEYRDIDGDGRYGLADETVQSVALASLAHQTSVTPLLGGGQTATVAYTLPENASEEDPILGGRLPEPPGTLRLTFTFVPAPSTVAATPMHPVDIGLGTEVRDFPFQAGDSRLALVADVATDAVALADDPSGGLSARLGQLSWLVAWAPTARVDGGEGVAAWSRVASEADRATAVLSLPRGDLVTQGGSVSAHSFRADVVEALRDLPPGDWRFYALGLAGAALALGVPSLRRLKER